MKIALKDRLPGYFCVSVREVDLAARLDVSAARLEVARLVLEAAGRLQVDELVTLQSDKLPFKLQLYLRHKDSSNLILYADIEGDPEARRLERIRRALDDKCKKLESWAKKDGRTMPTTPPQAMTAQGTILGTFQYMAPEQVEGGEADARTTSSRSAACSTR